MSKNTKLIILNGPVGVGKTTIAERIHELFSPSYLLSCDAIRRFTNDYHNLPHEGRGLRNKIVLSMLDVLMAENMTTILEQLHTDANMLDKYHEIAKKHGIEVYEYFLWMEDKDAYLNRFNERDQGPTKHPDSSLTMQRASNYWDSMKHFTLGRNASTTIVTDELSIEETTSKLMGLLEGQT